MRRAARFFASRSFVALALLGTTALTPAAASPFGKPLVCARSGQSTPSASARWEALAAHSKPSSGASSLAWVREAIAGAGYSGALPDDDRAQRLAAVAADLLQQGHIVAAKMANDAGASLSPAYRQAAFSAGLEALLTALTQPVHHASYPSAVRAAHEVDGASRGHHTHGTDIEASSSALMEVISRAHASKQALGDAYARPEIRFYLLAHGFRDPVALEVAGAEICATTPTQELVNKLDISSRFMAMPFRAEPAPQGGGK